MTYEEYKNLLEKTAPDGKFNGGFLAAFELGHLQGIKEGANSNEVNRELFEALIELNDCGGEIPSYECRQKVKAAIEKATGGNNAITG